MRLTLLALGSSSESPSTEPSLYGSDASALSAARLKVCNTMVDRAVARGECLPLVDTGSILSPFT